MKKVNSLLHIMTYMSVLANMETPHEYNTESRKSLPHLPKRVVAHKGCYFYVFNLKGYIVDTVTEYRKGDFSDGLIVIQARSVEVAERKFEKKLKLR